MKTAEQWASEHDWEFDFVFHPTKGIEEAHKRRRIFIRQIQADTLRWAVSELRGDALVLEQNRLLNKANQLDPLPKP